MSLEHYKRKRSFKTTAEPEGGNSVSKELLFVVQKHAAVPKTGFEPAHLSGRKDKNLRSTEGFAFGRT